ncbi:MAG TPA: site-specific integrase, partial [Bacteroidia bacterium]|nr:site-specific integrase [Bacteroidia bacterium]
MAVKVKLRQKAISGKRKSLYLDFYPPIPHSETGAPTRRQFLGLYIQAKASSPVEKESNKEVMKLAEQIRNKREIELSKPEIYMEYEREQLKIKEKGERSFIDYFRTLANKRLSSNHDNWASAFKYLNAFTGGTLKFADLDEKFCNEFKEHLLTTKSNKSDKAVLSQNSAVSYFNKLKAALKQAYKDGYLPSDLNSRVEPIKQAEVKRSFLTIEELNVLVKTECQNPLLKRAALFSALTGLRFSDIEKLLWSEIEHINGSGYFIQFKQQKTKGVEMLPISE